MAYDTQEERLKVRGSEQITRDLKVNRDAFVLGNLEASEVKSNGDLDVQGEMIARNDLSVSGDLYVNGTEHINDTETAQTSDDYLVLRHNKTTALGANEHAGVVVHNYMPNKTATLTTDNTGTWRVADNTETETTYTNLSYYNGTYYSGLGQGTTATVTDGIKSAWDEDELSECVFYNNAYYHFDGSNYFEVELSGNVMVLGTMVTDPDVITALQALTSYDLVYFRSLSVTTINEVENEPLLTRDEASNLSNNHFLSWDSTGNKAVDSGMSPNSFAAVATSGNYNDLTNKPSITPVDSVTNGNMNPVTSNAVFDFVYDNTLDWDNAVVINAGNMLCAAGGNAGNYIDINGQTHYLAVGEAFHVDWRPTKAGKLFPGTIPNYHIAYNSNGVPTPLSNESLATAKTVVISAVSAVTESVSALNNIFQLYMAGTNTTSWSTYANVTTSAIGSSSSNPGTVVTYHRGATPKQLRGIEIPRDLYQVMSLAYTGTSYPPSGTEPPKYYISCMIFVPYKYQ